MKAEKYLKRMLNECPGDVLLFTTGAYILPAKLANGMYAWVVSSFEDSTLCDGEYVAVSENWTNNIEELAGDENDDE